MAAQIPPRIESPSPWRDAALEIGLRIAGRRFASRGQRRVEVHISQPELAALLTLAAEYGAEFAAAELLRRGRK